MGVNVGVLEGVAVAVDVTLNVKLGRSVIVDEGVRDGSGV